MEIGNSLLEVRLMIFVKLVVTTYQRWVGEGNGRGCTSNMQACSCILICLLLDNKLYSKPFERIPQLVGSLSTTINI